MQKKSTLKKRLAELEFINDQLITELSYLDHLMKSVGFTEGLVSLKQTAQEIYEKEQKEREAIEGESEAA